MRSLVFVLLLVMSSHLRASTWDFFGHDGGSLLVQDTQTTAQDFDVVCDGDTCRLVPRLVDGPLNEIRDRVGEALPNYYPAWRPSLRERLRRVFSGRIYRRIFVFGRFGR